MKKTIKEIVESYGVKLWPIGEGIFRGFCPMHKNVNTASFTVYENTDSYFCFGESVGGDAANFISRMEGISYAEAKQRISGDTNTMTEIVEILDGLHVKDEVNYNEQLNFAVSKFCRDLIYRKPELTNNVMEFLKKLDKQLQAGPISVILMEEILKQSRQLEKL